MPKLSSHFCSSAFRTWKHAQFVHLWPMVVVYARTTIVNSQIGEDGGIKLGRN